MNAPKFRPLKFGVTRVSVRDGAPGTRYLQADQALQVFPERLTDRLQHWAQVKPEQTFMARRVKNADGTLGDWRQITYAQAWQTACCIAQGLIDRHRGIGRTVDDQARRVVWGDVPHRARPEGRLPHLRQWAADQEAGR